MSAGPRYHGPRVWARDREDAVRCAVRTHAQAFGAGYRRPDWRGPGWLSSQQWRQTRREEPRWFAGASPRRPFQGSREPGYWRPRYSREERQSNWQPPPAQRLCDSRFRPTPRRGQPVAVIEVPHWPWQEALCERRPRRSEPRGPLRGGPERSASDPRQSKTTQAKAKQETKEKNGAKWPTVVIVEKSGKEKTWGPLSRTAAWEAGCYWEETKGDAKIFLEKGDEKIEVSVEKLIGKDGPRFWFKNKKPEPPEQQPEIRLEDQSVTEDAADETTTEEEIKVMSEVDP